MIPPEVIRALGRTPSANGAAHAPRQPSAAASPALWVVAGAAAVLAVLALGAAAYLLVLRPLAAAGERDRRREQIIRQEPWRRFEPNNGFAD